jgi:Uncharacterized conserved protein
LTIYQARTQDAADLIAVQVVTDSVSVELIQTEEQQLKVEIQGEGGRSDELARNIDLELRTEGDTAVVAIKETPHVFAFSIGGWTRRVKAVIHVPARLFERIEVSAKSADITVRQILAETLSLTSASGDISAENCEAKKTFNVRSASGDVRITGMLSGETASAHASSGDLELRNLSTRTLEAGTHSGDITVSDFRGRLQAKTGSGDIDLRNDQLTGDLHLQAGSGDITVSFLSEPESFTVHFQGSSGDGKVRISGLNYEEKSYHRVIGKKGSGDYHLNVRTGSGDFMLE